MKNIAWYNYHFCELKQLCMTQTMVIDIMTVSGGNDDLHYDMLKCVQRT